MIFVQGLVSTKDAEIRRRILNKLEYEPNITLQQIADDCQRYVSVKQDSKKIEESRIAHVRKIRYKKKQSLPLKLTKQRINKIFCPLIHIPDVGPYIGTKIVLSGTRNVSYATESNTKARIADLKIKPIATWKIQIRKNLDGANTRKFVHVKMFKQSVIFQLDSGSDLILINLQTWKRLDKPTMIKSS